eukprot:SAG11_NODE_846_length_6884_cov_5.651732_6_plen_63_part_00
MFPKIFSLLRRTIYFESKISHAPTNRWRARTAGLVLLVLNHSLADGTLAVFASISVCGSVKA